VGVEEGGNVTKMKKGQEQRNQTLGLCSKEYAATPFTVEYFVLNKNADLLQ
jgi:hypothetical protein